MSITAEKPLSIRTKRGKLIMEMGLVSRSGQREFTVKSPVRNDSNKTISRNEAGQVVCTCDEFKQQFQTDQRYRCEHILAVKYYLEDGPAKQ